MHDRASQQKGNTENVIGRSDIKVKDGQSVKEGEAVIVLEAMKMENDIAANASGRITVLVQKGATVNTGDVLAVIE